MDRAPHVRPDRHRHVEEAARFIAGAAGSVPGIAVVLGSGLGAFADRLSDATRVPYGAIPRWPLPQVAGHAGQLVSGICRGKRVLALAGRVHLYEGHDPWTVTFGVRVLARAGVRTLLLTNAAGGVNPRLAPGTLMVIDDHIGLLVPNPLVGSPEEGRPRFPDMSEIYSVRLRQFAAEAASEHTLKIDHGIYAALSGPSYETPAEIRALRALGADAVGMSTVLEAIVARHAGIEVLGLSCISNLAAGILPQPLAEAEVLEVTARVSDQIGAVLEGVIARL
jgi:purine-nucleoside phosphorylase